MTERNERTRTVILVLLYTRTSYEERVRGSESNGAQLRRLRLWAEHEGWEVAGEYGDEDWSGKLLARPDLNRLRERVREGGISHVLTTKRDRLMRDGRRREDLDEELARHGATARAQSGESDDPGPFGRYMNRQLDAFSELEREVIAERMGTGRREKALKGRPLGNTLPGFGYRYERDARGKPAGFEVDEGQMGTVRLIFELAGARRMPLHALAKELDRRGLPTPPSRTRPEGSGTWSRRSLRNIILDDKYRPFTAAELRAVRHPESSWEPEERVGEAGVCGVLWWNRTSAEHTKIPDDTRPKGYRTHVVLMHNPPEEHVAIPIPDAGIPAGVVEAARQAIADNKAPSETRRGDRVWQLSGVAVCRHCGRNMVANSVRKNKGRKFWYRCPTRRDDKEACVHATHHQAPELEEEAWAQMQLLLYEPERAQRAYEAEIARRREGFNDPEREARSLEDELARLDRRRSGYQDLAADGLMDRAELRGKLAEIKRRRAEAERELAEARDADAAIEGLRRDMNLVFATFEQIRTGRLAWPTPQARQDLYRALRTRVEVDADGYLSLLCLVDPADVAMLDLIGGGPRAGCRSEPLYQL